MNEKNFPISLQDIVTIFGFWGILFGILSQIGISPFYSIITMIIPIFIVIFLIQIRIWRREEYGLIIRKENQAPGDEYAKYFEKAKNTIYITHFRREIPSEKYLAILHQASDRGIKINRVVGFKKAELSKHEYTKWILNEMGRPHTEHRFLALDDRNIPFEFIVFDGKIGVIALPSKDILPEGVLPYAIFSTNRVFIDALETIFKGYWDQAEK